MARFVTSSVRVLRDAARIGSCLAALAIYTVPPAAAHVFFPPVQFVGDSGGLAAPSTVVASPDGQHLYVGSRLGAISTFERDAATGAVTFVGEAREGVGGIAALRPLAMIASPDGTRLYVQGDGTDQTRLTILTRDAGTGALALLGVETAGGFQPVRTMAMTPDSEALYMVGADRLPSTKLEAWQVTPGGAALVQTLRHTPATPIPGLVDPTDVAVSPDSAHVYVTSRSEHAVAVFRRETPAITLAPVAVVTGIATLQRPSDVVVSPDGAHVYVAGRLGPQPQIVAFARNPATGALTFLQNLDPGAGTVTGAVVDLLVAPDGDHLYASIPTTQGQPRLHALARDAGTGLLTYAGSRDAGSRATTALTIAPDGGHVYTVAVAADALDAYARDAGTGALAFVEREYEGGGIGGDGLGGASGLALAPDGAHVYVAGRDDEAIGVFARDGTSGSVSALDTVRLTPGLGGVAGLAVSPDGLHLYAAGSDDDALVVFARTPATGALAPTDVLEDGVGGVDGIDGAAAVIVTPDGAHVLVAGAVENALAVFARDPGTGALALVQVLRDATGGVSGLAGVRALAVTPDGAHVVVTGSDPSTAAVFARDAGTGALTFVEQVTGLLASPTNVIGVSADGAWVYVASMVFARDATSGRLRAVPSPGVVLPGIPVADGTMLFQGRESAALDLRRGSAHRLWESTTRSVDLLGPFATSPDGRFIYAIGRDVLDVYGVTPCAPLAPGAKVFARDVVGTGYAAARLQLTAGFTLRGATFAALEPLVHGLRLRVRHPGGSLATDTVLPSGAFGGSGTRGWRGNGTGTTWRYLDKTVAPLGGITKVLLKRGKTAETAIVKLASRATGVPAVGLTNTVDLTVEAGPGFATCGAHGALCEFDAGRDQVRCRMQ